MTKRFWRGAGLPVLPVDLVTCGERDWRDAAALLARAYVTDPSGRFALHYDDALLRWIFTPPGQPPEWIIAARDRKWNLAGFISAAPAVVRIDGRELPHAIVNLLCIDEEWRRRGLAALLIEELTERVVARGITRAIFTGAMALAERPFATAPLFARLLAPRELLAAGFVNRPAAVSEESFVERHAVRHAQDERFRRLEPRDLAAVRELFARATQSIRVAPLYDDETLRHLLATEPGRAYVLDEGEIVAAIGMHPLPYAVRGGGTIPAAAVTFLTPGPHVQTLFEQLPLAAMREGFHALNVAALMNIGETLIALRYLPTSAHLDFHLYDDREDAPLLGNAADIALFPF